MECPDRSIYFHFDSHFIFILSASVFQDVSCYIPGGGGGGGGVALAIADIGKIRVKKLQIPC